MNFNRQILLLDDKNSKINFQLKPTKMAKLENPFSDKTVGYVFETDDYNKFKPIKENRGQAHNDGLKKSKLKKLQDIVDRGRWIKTKGRVTVNLNGQITDGRHTHEICKRNGMPIVYVIEEDYRFNNGTSKIEMINNIFTTNTVDTRWNPSEFFNAAVQVKAPLALLMSDLLTNETNGDVEWSEVLALLLRDEQLFTGHFDKFDLMIFKDKDLISKFESEEFKAEFRSFKKINDKARIAIRKGTFLKAAYSVIWHAGEIVNIGKFRGIFKYIADSGVKSVKFGDVKSCIAQFIQKYNQQVSPDERADKGAVLAEIRASQRRKADGVEEEVGETNKHKVIGSFQGKFATVS